MLPFSLQSLVRRAHQCARVSTPALLLAVIISGCAEDPDSGAGRNVESGGAPSGGVGAGGVAAGGFAPSNSGGIAGAGGASTTPAGGGGQSSASGGSRESGAGSGGNSRPDGGTAGGVGEGGAVGGGGSAPTSGAAGMAAQGGTGGAGGAGGTAGIGNQGGAGGSGAAYQPCPTNGEPCRIMPLGDSITEGTTFGGGYRVELFHQSLANSKKITFVGSWARASAGFPAPDKVDGVTFPKDHEGHSGYNIDETNDGWGLYPKYTKAIPTYKPNIILLMIGTNDINNRVEVANAPTRLGHLLDVLSSENPASLIVVAQIIPTRNAQTNTEVRAYNAKIPALVEQRAAAGKHFLLVDMHGKFAANANYSSEYMHDELHPNQAGFSVMGKTWYEAIQQLLH